MENWQRFAAFNQEHQSPIPNPQRRNWNHGNVSKQNFYHRGKFVENYTVKKNLQNDSFPDRLPLIQPYYCLLVRIS